MKRSDFSRADRVADQIQRELAALIDRELGDPRVGAATLSGVEVSPDLRNARIFVTPAVDTDVEATIGGLTRAAGFLRRKLGERLHMKYLPALKFEYDSTLDTANRITELLEATQTERTGAGSGSDEDVGRE